MVQHLIDDAVSVLQRYLPSSVRIRESHEQSLPTIHMDPNQKLTLALVELHAALEAGRAG